MKVAIAGYGIEGKASLHYWRELGAQVWVLDERDIDPGDLQTDVKKITGKAAFNNLEQFDLVVRSPSIAPSKLASARRVTSATNEFMAKCQTPIIGVTGTKGKGTAASLIASILAAAGKKVSLVGNIGQPALEVLDQAQQSDVVIYELSSFQLWDAQNSPHVAVVLPVEADHLDVHKDMADYLQAKANVRRYQTSGDLCIYHPTDDNAQQIAASLGDKSLNWQDSAKRYGVPEDGQVYVSKGNFCLADQIICSADKLQLPGAHNLDNACAAISAAWQYTEDKQAIANGLAEFKGLDHRLKLVDEIKGVKYYDDSIATTPSATMAAIKAFTQNKILILGGSDKGASYDQLAQITAKSQSVKAIIIIGQVGPKIAESIKQAGVDAKIVQSSSVGMTDIVKQASELASSGDVVILSPAAASFDMFSSYADRGEQFVAAVSSLNA